MGHSVNFGRKSPALAAAGLLLLALPARGAESTFQVGDLYLYLRSYTATDDAIIRIDPVTGAFDVRAGYATTNNRTLTYDPWRHRLVFTNNREPSGVRAMDADGNITLVAPFTTIPQLVAARGDGILYLWGGPQVGMRYLDAANVVHDLLNEAGTGPFTFGPGATIDEMIYDPLTNSIIGFVGDFTGVFIPQCPDAHASCAVRVPLSTDGTRVAGAVTAAQADISPSFEMPVGAGYAPGGGIYWVVDTNTNEREPRMQLLSPGAMSLIAFASNGPYIGAAATNAGTYSSRRGQGVILDPSYHDLRAFNAGEAGDGTAFAGGVDPSASTIGRLIEIHTAPVATGVEAPRPSPAVTLRVVSGNPFRSQVRLRLYLPEASRADLSIHDVRGRLVRALAGEWFAAGVRDVVWDARDAGGEPVAPGIYFAMLRAGGRTTILKLTVND